MPSTTFFEDPFLQTCCKQEWSYKCKYFFVLFISEVHCLRLANVRLPHWKVNIPIHFRGVRTASHTLIIGLLSSVVLSWTWYWTFGINKWREISWPATRLVLFSALQGGPCFKELVSSFVNNEFSLQRKLAKAVHICTSISTIPHIDNLAFCCITYCSQIIFIFASFVCPV